MTAAIATILFAVSISSDKIDSFMKLPDWMPTEVDAVHTFGSDDRTNCTRRTTLDTLAAVESVFDAYYERMLFMSEGRSNNWDVAKYGPRPSAASALNKVEFTNFLDHAGVFVYGQVSTNETDHPRQVSDTRRLVEFGNLFTLSGFIAGNMFEDYYLDVYDRGLFLPCVPTWTNESHWRMVYPGSSWMPGDLAPPDFSWRSSFPSLGEWAITNCCLPIWECQTDGVFRTTGSYTPYRDAYGDLHLQEQWLRTFDLGELEMIQEGTGYLYDLFLRRPWVGESVPDLIRAKFPLSSPESGITNRTRRLVTDDYFTYDIGLELRKVSAGTASLRLDELRPDGTKASWYEVYTGTPIVFDTAEDLVLSTKGPETFVLSGEFYHSRYSYQEDHVGGTFGSPAKFSPDLSDDQFVVPPVRVIDPARGHWLMYDLESRMAEWSWSDPVCEVEVDYYVYIPVTNAVYTNSSVIATESRALAMLDRTYEVAQQKWGPVVSSNLEHRISASTEPSGSAPVTGELSETWEQGGDDYSVIRMLQPSDEPTKIKLSGGPVTQKADTVSSPNYDTRARFRFSGIRTSVGRLYYIPQWLGVAIETNVAEIGGTDFRYSLRPSPGSDDIVLTSREFHSGEHVDIAIAVTGEYVSVKAAIPITQTATLYKTSPAMKDRIDELYPWYGPGRLSFSTGRVGECKTTLGAAIMKLVGIRQSNGMFADYDGWTGYGDLHYDWYPGGTYYSRETMYSVKGETVSNNRDAVDAVADALAVRGFARSKFDSTCNESAGTFGPEILSPSLSLITNSSEIAVFNGGYFYVKCPASGTRCIPDVHEFSVGFAPYDAGETPMVDYERAYTAPVSADLRLSDPLISTQWNWKALKTQNEDN